VASLQAEFDSRGFSIVVISFAEPAKLVGYQERHKWPFPILADPRRRAYEAFALPRLSLWRVFSPATLRLYAQLLWRRKRLENYGREDFYQSGGDFLIDRQGTVLFAHRSREPADRPSPKELLEKIELIRMRRATAGTPSGDVDKRQLFR
jgi:peroxiredoxin